MVPVCTLPIRLIALFWLLTVALVGAQACDAATAGSNPAYVSYDFGTTGKTVVFGSQPMGIIAAVVPELMHRDRILAGQLKRLGLELKVLPFYNGPDINHFMKQGKVAAAMAGDFPTFSIASAEDVHVVAISKRDKAAVVTDKKYRSIKELTGKRVSFPEGSSSHLGLLVVLEAAGMKEEEFKMLPMGIDQLVPAISSGQTDAIAGWEPVPTLALAANHNLRIISQFLNTDFYYWRGSFAAQHAEASRCLLAAYSRSINWMNKSDANLTAAATWSLSSTQAFLGAGKPLPLPLDKLKVRIRENLALIGSAAIPVTEFADGSYLQRAFDLLKRKGRLPENAEWRRVQRSVKTQYLKEINADRKKYQTTTFDYDRN